MTKRLCLLTFLIALPAIAADTVYVAVGTTATPMPATKASLRTSVLLENNGSGDIWCQYSAPGSSDAPSTIQVGRGHKVAAGSWRSFPGDKIWCIAAVAQDGCAATATDCTSVSEVN